MPAHTELWQARKAKDPRLQFGTDVEGYWYWYDSWVSEVRKHCQENVAKYRSAAEAAQSASHDRCAAQPAPPTVTTPDPTTPHPPAPTDPP